MKILWIVLAVAALLVVLFVWCCCQMSGREDKYEPSYLDAEWSPVEERYSEEEK